MPTWCFGLIVMFCPPAEASATAGALFCDVATPMYWSPADTRKSKEEMDRHNARGKARCGWGKK